MFDGVIEPALGDRVGRCDTRGHPMSVDAAVSECLAGLDRSLETETVPLAAAVGRILRQEIRSPENLPAFARSVVDGVAVRRTELLRRRKIRLPVQATVPAGTTEPEPLAAGHAIRVMAGAPVPEGADWIIGNEDFHLAGNAVHIHRHDPENSRIVPAGADFRAGDPILACGMRITPQAIGLLSALGIEHVNVSRRPRLAILVTGNELVRGSACGPGQVRDVIGPLLCALSENAGSSVHCLEIASDDVADICEKIVAASAFDCLIVAGGQSRGDCDNQYAALKPLCVSFCPGDLPVAPGRPLRLVRYGRQWIWGLSGSPTAALVNFVLLVRPMLDAMAGKTDPLPEKAFGVVHEDCVVSSSANRLFFAKHFYQNGCSRLVILSSRHFTRMPHLLSADVLVEVPGKTSRLKAGDRVGYYDLTAAHP